MSALVSVIMPVYNRPEVIIRQAVNSFVLQDSPSSELIIVNDGSNRVTVDALELIAQEHENIRLIHQENKGASSARNTGIKNATGKYVAFLDDDDIWLPGKLRSQIEILQEHNNIYGLFSDANIVTCGLEFISGFFDKKGGLAGFDLFTSETQFDIIQAGPDIEMIHKGFILTSTVVLRTCVFERAGYFDESLRGGEDVDLFFRLTRNFDFAVLRKRTVNYRLTPNSLSRQGLKSIEDAYHLSRKLHTYNLSLSEKAFLRRSEAEIIMSLAYCLFQRNDFVLARGWFFKAFVEQKSFIALLYLVVTFLPAKMIYLIRFVKNAMPG